MISAAFGQAGVAIVICNVDFAPRFVNMAGRRLLCLNADAAPADLGPGWLWADTAIDEQSVRIMIERDGSWRGSMKLVPHIPAGPGREAEVDISAFRTDITAGFIVVAREAPTDTLLSRHASEIDLINRSGRLTAREKEVVLGLLEGLSNKSIALRMAISPRTVEFHRARLMIRFTAKSLVELIRKVVHDDGMENSGR